MLPVLREVFQIAQLRVCQTIRQSPGFNPDGRDILSRACFVCLACARSQPRKLGKLGTLTRRGSGAGSWSTAVGRLHLRLRPGTRRTMRAACPTGTSTRRRSWNANTRGGV